MSRSATVRRWPSCRRPTSGDTPATRGSSAAFGTRCAAANAPRGRLVRPTAPRSTHRWAATATFRRRVEAWRMEGPVIKINCALSRLPTFTASSIGIAHRAMVTIASSIDETQAAYARSRAGEPAPRWMELYFHTAYDGSVAPEGHHVVSIFAQYAPYTPARGTWDDHRAA